MKSIISAAIFGAAALTEAASVRHAHTHLHSKRAAAKAPIQKRAPILTERDANILSAAGILAGKNLASGNAITASDDGPFKMELNNLSGKDIQVVVWGTVNADLQGAADACFVGKAQPEITHSLAAGQNVTISFAPGDGNSISGAVAPVYPGGGLTSFSGQVDDTWLEYTYTTKEGAQSTTDVSRLINMSGNKIEAHNFANDYSRQLGLPQCSSTMEQISYVCADDVPHCDGWTSPAKLINCPEGTPDTTCDAAGLNGGCNGIGATGGVTMVNFY